MPIFNRTLPTFVLFGLGMILTCADNSDGVSELLGVIFIINGSYLLFKEE